MFTHNNLNLFEAIANMLTNIFCFVFQVEICLPSGKGFFPKFSQVKLPYVKIYRICIHFERISDY